MSNSARNFENELDAALERLRATVVGAIEEAHEAFAEINSVTRTSDSPPSRQFFASCVMQLAYCVQCGANSKSFRGGDSKLAWHSIKNAVDISNHYWGSKFELRNE